MPLPRILPATLSLLLLTSPALAQSVGRSARLFKGELKAMKDDDAVPLDHAVAPAHPEPRSTAVVADPPPTR